MRSGRGLALVFALLIGYPDESRAQKFARPDGTLADGGWTPAAPNSHLEIDDLPHDDTTWVEASTGDTPLEVTLSDIFNPPAGSHIMRFRIFAPGTDGGAREELEMELFQGATLIATMPGQQQAFPRDTWITYEYTLTAGEVAAITNYADLRFRFSIVSGVTGGDVVRVTWAELVVLELFTSGTNLRSIGTNCGGLYATGTATVTGGTDVVNFGAPASLPLPTAVGAVGPGDRLALEPGTANEEVLYIKTRNSATQVTVQSNAVGGHSGPYEIRRAFCTLQDWEDYRQGNLVTDNRLEFGVAYKDGVFTSGVFIDGSTTDSTHFLRLTVAPGQRHNGTAGTGVVLDGENDWFYDSTKQVANSVIIDDYYTRLEWFELIRHTATSGSPSAVAVEAQNVLVENVLVHQYDGVSSDTGIRMSGSAGAGNSLIVRNSIIYDGQRGIAGDEADFSLTVENCTVYGMNQEGVWGDAKGMPVTARNTISMGNASGDFVTVTTQEDNISSDGSASCPTCFANRAATDLVNPGAGDWVIFQDLTPGLEDLHLKAGDVKNWAIDEGQDLSPTFLGDIDGHLRPTGTQWDIGADEQGSTTAVALLSLGATGLDGEVLLQWETGSELNNLGFHLYRAVAADDSYERITGSVIPGLGSSPEGARYRFRDTGLVNGVTYYYKLEDIETTGRTELHGPVSATPRAGAVSTEGAANRASQPSSLITYGNPSANRFEVLLASENEVVLELTTEGFHAEPLQDGTVRLSIPGFEPLSNPSSPSVPLKRPWVEAVAGLGVRLLSVEERGVLPFTGLRPAGAAQAEVVGSRQGTVRLALRPGRRSDPASANRLYPKEAARILGVGYQGEVKKIQVELAPLRWEGVNNRLLLARRLVARLKFDGEARHERSLGGARGRLYRLRTSHGRRNVVARLATKERGLHLVRHEEIFPGRRAVPSNGLRLSRLGAPVAFHIEPGSGRFAPGSRLYFLSEGAKVNPYGDEAVYELELGAGGVPMAVNSASPVGKPTSHYRKRVEQEVNRYYQAALLAAEDRWLWDVLMAPAKKSFAFQVRGLASAGEASRLSVWLQGASDFAADPDHHVRVYLNGNLLDEVGWDGKMPQMIEVTLLPGQLSEGENLLALENVGDTGASYSMVFLDRFAVEYGRALEAEGGRLEGVFGASGVAEVSGVGAQGYVVDVTDEDAPVWLPGVGSTGNGAVRFRAEGGRCYLVVGAEHVGRAEVRRAAETRLKRRENGADYLVIGPAAFLDEAQPLLELRRSERLRVKAVAVEEVYEEFGFGEERPEAIGQFIEYAYHRWRAPAVRYVLLLGDGTYDFKNYLGTGVANRVPPLLVPTTYLWTASDPTLAAVNGDDLLPDVAVGRLPAATEEELRVMVEKILTYERREGNFAGPLVLVADNPDAAGDFVANAERIASGALSGREVRKLYLSELGTRGTRAAILDAFDEGASLMSYIGHGGIHLWANENLFNTGKVASLSPQGQQPLFVTMNCLNGYFHFPYFNSLSEEVVKAEGKGAIAAFSPAGLSLNEPAQLFHQALLEEVFHRGHERLGDAVLAAQEAYASTGAFPELLTIYHLLGDPALRVR